PTPAAAGVKPGSTTWRASQVAPNTVIVNQLPRVTDASVPHRPLLVKDPVAYAAAKRSPQGPPGAAIAQPSVSPRAIQTASPPFAQSFVGITLADEQAHGVSVEPPD